MGHNSNCIPCKRYWHHCAMLVSILQATMNAFMRYCYGTTLGVLQQMAAAAFLRSILMRWPGRISAGTYDVSEVLSTQDAARTVSGSGSHWQSLCRVRLHCPNYAECIDAVLLEGNLGLLAADGCCSLPEKHLDAAARAGLRWDV